MTLRSGKAYPPTTVDVRYDARQCAGGVGVSVRRGDVAKQVAVLEFGWTSDRVNPSYAWFAIDEQTKADYLVRAYWFAKTHWTPWIGPMIVSCQRGS